MAQRWWRRAGAVSLLAWLATMEALAGPQVVARGLFAGRALLEIDGQARLVKAGETTEEGVLLVSSTSKEAVVEVDGARHTLTLTRQISATFVESPATTVTIPRSDDTHFRVKGTIDGHPVEMMVDTGATAVVMNAREAQRLGIDFRKGKVMKSATAGGMVDSFMVDLRRVSVGGIDVHNIKGVVVDGDFPGQTLLGNTFLNHVIMEQREDSLVLKRKY